MEEARLSKRVGKTMDRRRLGKARSIREEM
jgi:hypothetical protein